MGVKISRNPLAFRSRAKEVAVVVNADQPDLDSVRVKVCEIPRGLLQELRDDESFYRKEIEDLSAELAACELRKQEEVSRARAAASDLAAITAIQARHDEEAKTLRAKRKEARRALSGMQLSVIRWGVCDHNAVDFNDEETSAPFPFDEEVADYDGVKYRVASQVTLQAYVSVGLPFLQALFESVHLWQRGEVKTPAEIWQESRDRKERIRQRMEQTQKQLAGEASPDPLALTETTPTQTTTDSENQTN